MTVVLVKLVKLPDEGVIQTLCDWRNNNRYHFFDNKMVTVESTREWLRDFIGRQDKALYLVNDSDGLVGHIGYRRKEGTEAEIHAVLRGRAGEEGVMSQALETLFRELKKQGIKSVYLTTFPRTFIMTFYARLGFEVDRVRMSRRIV